MGTNEVTSMQVSASNRTIGIASLILAVFGLLSGIAVELIALALHSPHSMLAWLVIIPCEIAALVLGIVAFKTPFGKAGVVFSVLVLVLLALFTA